MRRLPVLVLAGAVLGALVWFGVSYVDRDARQGLDTTCGDLVKMNRAQRIAVMKEAGVDSDHRKERVAYYLADCRAHPEDRSHPISNITG